MLVLFVLWYHIQCACCDANDKQPNGRHTLARSARDRVTVKIEKEELEAESGYCCFGYIIFKLLEC